MSKFAQQTVRDSPLRGVIGQQRGLALLALTRRRLVGGLIVSLGLTSWFGRQPKPAVQTRDGFVIVNGWVLKRSDLDLLG